MSNLPTENGYLDGQFACSSNDSLITCKTRVNKRNSYRAPPFFNFPNGAKHIDCQKEKRKKLRKKCVSGRHGQNVSPYKVYFFSACLSRLREGRGILHANYSAELCSHFVSLPPLFTYIRQNRTSAQLRSFHSGDFLFLYENVSKLVPEHSL